MGLPRSIAPLFFALAAGAPALAQSTVQFQDGVLPTPSYSGTRDTIIKSQTSSLNFGTLPRLRVTTAEIGGGTTRTLLRWDVSAYVPPGCVVTDARIGLYVSPEDPGGTTQIYELRRDWVEGDGSTASGASWSTYDGVNNWGSPGASSTTSDRGSTSLGSVPGSTGFKEVVLNATGRAVVQGWIDDPSSNFGVTLQANISNAVDYVSRDAEPSDQPLNRRPRLLITYTLPPVGPASTSTLTLRDGSGGYSGTRDSRIRSDRANNNYGANSNLQTRDPSRNALVSWDVSSVPSGSTITQARIELYFERQVRAMSVHQLLRGWVEGNNSSGSGVTWNTTNGTTPWGTPGATGAADSGATVLGSIGAGGSQGFRQITLNANGLNVVRDWVATPASNFGFLFRGTANGTNRWSSRETNTSGREPALILSLSTAGNPTRTINGGSDWANPAAWSPAGLPGANDVVVVQGPGTVTINDAAPTTYSIFRLRIEGGAVLEQRTSTLEVSEITAVSSGRLELQQAATVFRAQGITKVFPGAELRVHSGATLRLPAATTWIGGKLDVNSGNLVADNVANRTNVIVHGEADLRGMTFSGGAARGLQISRYCTLTRLEGCRFEGIDASAGASHLSVDADELCLNAPACYFDTVAANQFNVRLTDTGQDTPGDVALNFESRGAATNGPAAGEARESEVGGAALNWVYSAPNTTAGVAIGFPQTAYDLDTYAYLATYAAFRDVDAAGTDRIYVFDVGGAGINQGYHFDIPASAGDMVGNLWWDKLNGQNVIWALTSTGRVFRFTDPGSGSGAIAPDSGFPVTVTDGGAAVSFTAPPLTADHSFVYSAGTAGGANRLFAINAQTGALSWSVSAGLPEPVTGELSSELNAGLTYVYAGGGSVSTSGSVTLLDENFNGGTGGFSYQDDTFRGTNSPGQASGDYSGGGGQSGGRVRVVLGPFGANMSGGWVRTFTVPGTTSVIAELRLAYRLIQDQRYEFDEISEALVSIDGQLLGTPPKLHLLEFVGDGNDNGPDNDSGWQTATLRTTLTPGNHTLIVGGYNNKSTEGPEVTQILFDNVRITTLDTEGVLYRLDTQTRLVDLSDNTPSAPIAGAPIPVFNTGLFAGDEAGTVHGVNQFTMQPIAGWPKTSSAPMRCSVWVDFFAQQVFWGDENGTIYGFTAAGAQLSGFPIANALGTSAALREGLLSDQGVLWTSSVAGRVGAVDISTGNVISPSYRFGTQNVVGRVAQDANSRINVSTSCGQLLVLDAITDPTP